MFTGLCTTFFHRKATKATVVLFPLLGVTYIFFVKEPVHSKDLNITFSYINALLQSFQVSLWKEKTW